MNKINLYDLGLSERYTQEATMYEENLYIARVSVQHRDIYKVITEDGEIFSEISGKLNYSSKSTTHYPAVGDWVLVDRTTDKNGMFGSMGAMKEAMRFVKNKNKRR